MKYLDPTTRKRPMFADVLNKYASEEGKTLVVILCQCGTHLHTNEMVYHHWQNGHFDVYDEIKEKVYTNAPKVSDNAYKTIHRSPDCCGCPSFPFALCGPCARYNGVI